MRFETLKRVMEALAGVAESVGNLRALFPAGNDIVDDVAQKVTEVSDHVLESVMLGDVNSPERTGKYEDGAEAMLRKAERELVHGAPHIVSKPKAAKKATPRVAKATPVVSPVAPATKDKPKFAVQGTCTICGKTYLKRSPVQKTCSPECTSEKNKAYARAKYAEKSAPAGDAPGDRLSRIKAIDKKLDTIED